MVRKHPTRGPNPFPAFSLPVRCFLISFYMGDRLDCPCPSHYLIQRFSFFHDYLPAKKQLTAGMSRFQNAELFRTHYIA